MEKRGHRIGFSKRLKPESRARAFKCNSVYITRYQSMHIPVSICTSYTMADKKALVDSGATDNFMHPQFAARMGIGMKELPNPRKIWNIDETMNKGGYLTHYINPNLQSKHTHKQLLFHLTNL